ncbi:uncharacterized protein LOC126822383 [Patella vulgata]|uniref:uncharacterized protein LOC126822383 n=1 Tax=Patella vulgata TaxID=6465 RepID=UPI0021804336|nr:uncharacterized protein LOC126822383 [Patella vulgata]
MESNTDTKTESYHDLRYCVHDILRPLLKCMQLFGMYYDRFGSGSTSHRLSKFSKVYSVAVIVLVWINVLRYIPSFWVGFDYQPNHTVNRVIKQTWLLQCAVTTSILLWHCRKGTWNSFYNTWYGIITTGSWSNYINTKTKKMRRICKIFLFLGIIYFIFSIFSSLLSEILFNSSVMLTNPFPANVESAIAIIIFELFDVAAWIFPGMFMIAMCYCLKLAFSMVKLCLESSVQKLQGFPDNLNDIRHIHLKLCRMVEHLDKPISLWIVNVVGCNVFLACFIMYDLVRSGQNELVVIILKCSWLTNDILTVFITCWFMAAVNEEAHSPLEYIYDIKTDGLSTQQLGQLTLFLSKLTGTSIGFTAMGFFTITKEVILTIGGLYLTYFFLLLQFKIS